MTSLDKNSKKKRSSFWNDDEFARTSNVQYLPKVKINVIPCDFSGSEDNSNSMMKSIESFKFERKSPLKEKNEFLFSTSNNPSPNCSIYDSEISEYSNPHNIHDKTEKNELGADSIPMWAQGDGIRDKKLKKKNDFGYDPTTLFIPIEELNKMTPAMKQYWQIKSDHFDKIVLFKYGNFYETYYEDAILCHKILDLAWVGKKLNVGFPEKSLEKYSFMLVEKGHILCLVEQTETPNQMKERIKSQERGKKDKVINREITQIITRSTVIPPSSFFDQPRYLLSIGTWDRFIGFAIFELSRCEIQVGGFLDDDHLTMFKSFYSRFRPVEIIYVHEFLSSKLKTILTESEIGSTLTKIDDKKSWSKEALKKELEKNESDGRWRNDLEEILNSNESSLEYSLKALSGIFTYLHKLMLFPRLLPMCKISHLDLSNFSLTKMVLDEKTLSNLQIIDESSSICKSAPRSLFDYLNRTVTKSGKRLLRDWIKSPLLSANEIEQRLDAITELGGIDGLIDKIRIDLKRLPDLEKKFSKIFMMATQTGDKIISFENISEASLRDFKSILDEFLDARTILKDLNGFGFKSYLLVSLIEAKFSNQKEYDVEKIIFELSNKIKWEGTKMDIPTPKSGVDKNYDQAKETLESIELQFQKYLDDIRMRFNNDKRICYSHARHRYELEFPIDLVEGNKKPSDFEFSSKKQGFERFITQYIKILVQRLELAEEKLKICLNEFTIKIFKDLASNSEIWDRLIYCISSLDCLCSLAFASFNNPYPMCRPKIITNSERNILYLKESVHPLVILSKGIFVPNDVEIIDGIILLTGPNMGGKSTMLRQISLTILMAQIGCYVPAKEFNYTIVDRIFSRVGAYDDITNRKSTFFVELEDISTIVKYGTKNSFFVIDELGRGTSTFDGFAIAYSTLKYLATKIMCRGIFSTHFFNLFEELSLLPNVLPFHMVCKVIPEEDKIQFLYKLAKGKANLNFAFNVAALAGINKNTLKVAQEMKESFDDSLGLRKQNYTIGRIINLLQANANNNFSDFDLVFSKLIEFDI